VRFNFSKSRGVMEIFLVIFILTVTWLIDSYGAKQLGYGVVISKEYICHRSDWSTRRYIHRNRYKGGPYEYYKLQIRIAHELVSKSVSLTKCVNIKEGDRVAVVYYRGRLSKKIRIIRVEDSTMELDFMRTIPKSWRF